jgi:hypothetical protein
MMDIHTPARKQMEISIEDMRAVGKWLVDHPFHHFHCEECCDPLENFLTFVAHPTDLIEYDEIDNERVSGVPVQNGCKYIFRDSKEMCHMDSDGKEFCTFHDHVIFSEKLRDALNAFYSRFGS